MARTLAEAISEVVAEDNCSGCGACCVMDPGLAMGLNGDGYLRPVRRSGTATPDSGQVSRFESMCPGRVVSSPYRPGASRHPQLGSYLESWVVWASDPEIRYRGASGGALTALATWLTETGRAPSARSGSRSAASGDRAGDDHRQGDGPGGCRIAIRAGGDAGHSGSARRVRCRDREAL